MPQVESPVLAISIISHGQADIIGPLLIQLSTLASRLPIQVILTENLGEKATRRYDVLPLSIEYVVNQKPKGFGANHNAAFSRVVAPYFCVLNPDIRLRDELFERLLKQLQTAKGIVGPRVVNNEGQLEDSARYVPTLPRLLKRHLMGLQLADYDAAAAKSVDWMAGMCLMFDADVYRSLGGFDERFHLYCEDVDICLRAHLAGWSVRWAVDAVVEHDARRASRRKLRYLWWHLTSLAKLMTSATYRGFLSRTKE